MQVIHCFRNVELSLPKLINITSHIILQLKKKIKLLPSNALPQKHITTLKILKDGLEQQFSTCVLTSFPLDFQI